MAEKSGGGGCSKVSAEIYRIKIDGRLSGR